MTIKNCVELRIYLAEYESTFIVLKYNPNLYRDIVYMLETMLLFLRGIVINISLAYV